MGGGGSQTTVQKADPWKPAQPYLKDALAQGADLFAQGGFAPQPYGGDRLAGFGDLSQMAQGAGAFTAAQNAPGVQAGNATLMSMMDPQGQEDRLEAVKQDALGSAIPAAVSQFAGSGMGNSTMAMDTVGRAATEAVSPFDYGAYQQEQGRALQAAGMAPQLEQASYLPSQMLGAIGAQRDAQAQAEIDAQMQEYYETQNRDVNALDRYSQMLLGYGGQGGTQTSTQSSETGPMGMIGGGLQMAGLTKMLFPALFGGSDRRLKENIRQIGKTNEGHNLYLYTYKGEAFPHIGVMADEVPEAVAGQIDGYSVVDYSRVF